MVNCALYAQWTNVSTQKQKNSETSSQAKLVRFLKVAAAAAALLRRSFSFQTTEQPESKKKPKHSRNSMYMYCIHKEKETRLSFWKQSKRKRKKPRQPRYTKKKRFRSPRELSYWNLLKSDRGDHQNDCIFKVFCGLPATKEENKILIKIRQITMREKINLN